MVNKKMTVDEKILEWLGIHTLYPTSDLPIWVDGGHNVVWSHGKNLPHIGIEILVKYAVPKLDKTTMDYQRGTYIVWLTKDGKQHVSRHEDPAEAFKQALIKLMEEKIL